MLKIIKKNQLTILVISLMLVTAGYLNYNDSMQTSTEIAGIGDATLVSSNISNSIQNQTLEENTNSDNNVSNNTSEVASSISTNEENTQANAELTISATK